MTLNPAQKSQTAVRRTIAEADSRRDQGLNFARGHRYLLELTDAMTLSAGAALGAVVLSHVSPHRAGQLGVREVVVAAISMAIALHLHGLYHRPAQRLRPTEWWRPGMVARCVPTAALLALAVDAFVIRGGRMTLTAAVSMTLPAVTMARSRLNYKFGDRDCEDLIRPGGKEPKFVPYELDFPGDSGNGEQKYTVYLR